jgi:hypothetical protein
MTANLEAPKPLNSLLFALFAWLNSIHARGQIMLLFAYGSHACPYGDWSKEEKLTYVGGLFSCSLQVNFSSILLQVINRRIQVFSIRIESAATKSRHFSGGRIIVSIS